VGVRWHICDSVLAPQAGQRRSSTGRCSPRREGPKLSHLELYARRLQRVEVNSSFHRPHRRATWERWAAVTPDHFSFAVKAPKAITHTAKLVNTGGALLEFFDAVRGLRDKLGPVLIQLPPKLTFVEGIAQEFLTTLRELHQGGVVLEPRHAGWFSAPVDNLLRNFQVSRVAADPPKGSELASEPGGWPGLSYWRLHGSPRTYYSEYDHDWLQGLAKRPQLPKRRDEVLHEDNRVRLEGIGYHLPSRPLEN
jgi:uncharacterized protein YecE (DUF72 family)